MSRLYTSAEIVIAREMCFAGSRSSDVAAKLSRTVKAIANLRAEQGKSDSRWKLREKREWTRKDIESAYAMSLAGKTVREIAEHFGRTMHAVSQQVQKLRRSRKTWRAEPKQYNPGELSARVRVLSLPGVPDRDVAAILNTSRYNVRNCRKRLGIAARVPHGGKVGKVKPLKDGQEVTPAQRKALIIRWVANDPEITASRISGNVRCTFQNVIMIAKRLGISFSLDRHKQGADDSDDVPESDENAGYRMRTKNTRGIGVGWGIGFNNV